MDKEDFWECLGISDIRQLEVFEVMKSVIKDCANHKEASKGGFNILLSDVVDEIQKRKEIDEREKIAIALRIGLTTGMHSCHHKGGE